MGTRRLTEIRARLEAAEPGPWVLGDYRGFGDYDIETADGHDLAGERGMFHGQANAELAAHAPADLAYLLDRVERLEKLLDEFDRYSQEDPQYLGSPFCKEVRGELGIDGEVRP